MQDQFDLWAGHSENADLGGPSIDDDIDDSHGKVLQVLRREPALLGLNFKPART